LFKDAETIVEMIASVPLVTNVVTDWWRALPYRFHLAAPEGAAGARDRTTPGPGSVDQRPASRRQTGASGLWPPCFRGFNLTLSIDGHGELYEYSRHGVRVAQTNRKSGLVLPDTSRRPWCGSDFYRIVMRWIWSTCSVFWTKRISTPASTS
jgi:hypothetical protein